MLKKNEYAKSVLAQKVKARLKIAFLDIDNTLTGNPSDVNQVRLNLENLGFIISLVSARTEEMLMSTSQYQKSKKMGFKRPYPKLLKKGEKFLKIPIEKFEPVGIMDPEIIIGSSGTSILIKQIQGGYLEDKDFSQKLKENKNWRKNILNLLKKVDPKGQAYFLKEKEFPINFKKGLTNVLTPEYRIQVDFKNLINKEYFYKALQKNEHKFKLSLSDDSDLRVNKFSLYITPKGFSKGKAVNQVIKKICQTFNLKKKDLKILFAGDALADLDMSVSEKEGINSTLLIVGGSRLDKKTISNFISTIPGIPPKKIIIGDEAFPGTKGPKTLLKFLQFQSF